MPKLKKTQHEAFAQAIAKGKQPTEAYVSIYSVPNNAAEKTGQNLQLWI